MIYKMRIELYDYYSDTDADLGACFNYECIKTNTKKRICRIWCKFLILFLLVCTILFSLSLSQCSPQCPHATFPSTWLAISSETCSNIPLVHLCTLTPGLFAKTEEERFIRIPSFPWSYPLFRTSCLLFNVDMKKRGPHRNIDVTPHRCGHAKLCTWHLPPLPSDRSPHLHKLALCTSCEFVRMV